MVRQALRVLAVQLWGFDAGPMGGTDGSDHDNRGVCRGGARRGRKRECGNVIHHAVEMMLKGRLTHTLTLQQMADKP